MKQLVLPKKGKPKKRYYLSSGLSKPGIRTGMTGGSSASFIMPGECEDMAREAYSAYMFENALSPFDFPSLLKMETEFISMVSNLFHGMKPPSGP